MTIRSFPHDNTPIATELQWRDIESGAMSSGVLRGYGGNGAVFGDSSGMQIKVPSLQAIVDGVFFESDTQVTRPINAAHATLGRIDRCVVRLDRTANSTDIVVLPGTPSSTPVAPSLSQGATLYDIPLGLVTVDSVAAGGGSTIAANKVSTNRYWAGPRGGNMWTDFPQGSIVLLSDASGYSAAIAANADNRYRYQIIGSTCHVQFFYNITLSGTSGSSSALGVNLPVAPRAGVNYFAGAVQGGAKVVNTPFNSSFPSYVFLTPSTGTLVNGTSFYSFCGSYEIAQ